jgi:ubiquinone/menaquinone biosynthesis C-methylase UbiE
MLLVEGLRRGGPDEPALEVCILWPVGETTTLDTMRDYYTRRAEHYECVYLQPERQPDLRAMERWLPSMFEGRRVLEVACGTGWWTRQGARHALD